MQKKIPPFYHLSDEVAHALSHKEAVVALESTVITHGLPYPDNLQLAVDMQSELRKQGVAPAMVTLVDGKVLVGVQNDWLEGLAKAKGLHKLSARDIARAVAKGESGGTTVAGTMAVANQVGIQVFATGGIGGVHQGYALDISADLLQLARTPMIVVCAGAKAILDLPATLEYLETHSVVVVGYQTDEFPAFYARSSGLPVSAQADSAQEVVKIAQAHWQLGIKSAVLVTVPVPEETALKKEAVESAIKRAIEDASSQSVRGQNLTPYLLERVRQLTGGESLKANLGLLLNNARVAGEIACIIARSKMKVV